MARSKTSASTQPPLTEPDMRPLRVTHRRAPGGLGAERLNLYQGRQCDLFALALPQVQVRQDVLHSTPSPRLLFRESRRNRSRTNLLASPCIISGSVPLNSRIALRITGQPLPRCSMNPSPSMKFAMSSFRDRGCPPGPDTLGAHVIRQSTWAGNVDMPCEYLK